MYGTSKRVAHSDRQREYVSFTWVYASVLCLFVWLDVCVRVFVLRFFLFQHFIVMENWRQSKSCVCLCLYLVLCWKLSIDFCYATIQKRKRRTPRKIPKSKPILYSNKMGISYFIFSSFHSHSHSCFHFSHPDLHRNTKYAYCSLD